MVDGSGRGCKLESTDWNNMAQTDWDLLAIQKRFSTCLTVLRLNGLIQALQTGKYYKIFCGKGQLFKRNITWVFDFFRLGNSHFQCHSNEDK